MQLTNFQTLLLLLQVTICAANDTSALQSAAAAPTPTTVAWDIRSKIDPAVIGSTSVSAYESWTTWSCPAGSTWTTLLPYGGCRTTASVQAPMYTGCTNTSVLLGPFDHDTCTGTGAQTTCLTGWIHYAHNLTYTNYECWPTWTQGNWEASREDPTGLPLATILAISVVVPIVVIAAVVAGLWWWRQRRRKQRDRMLTLEGRRCSMTSTSTKATQAVIVAKNIELSHAMEKGELEEQRRASELSSTIAPRDSIIGPMERLEEERDDASSYHTTESTQMRHELQAQGPVIGMKRDPFEADERNTLQKMLHRFKL